MDSQTIAVNISRSVQDIYRYAHNPANLPDWAPGVCKSIRRSGPDWLAETPSGEIKLRFVEDNVFGILDHYVTLNSGIEIYVPMRVISTPIPNTSQLQITIFRPPNTSDEAFQQDLLLVRSDLELLKQLLERS